MEELTYRNNNDSNRNNNIDNDGEIIESMEVYSNFVGHPPQLTVHTSLVPATDSDTNVDLTSHSFETTYSVSGGNSYAVGNLPSPTDEGYATQGDLSRRSTTSTTQSSKRGDLKDPDLGTPGDDLIIEERLNVDASLRDVLTITPTLVEQEPVAEVIQEEQRHTTDKRSMKRFHALTHMIDSEREFTGNIRALIDYCLTPLSSIAWLSAAETATLTRNANELYAFQVRFMDEIDNACFSSNSDPSSNDIFQKIAQCFIDFADEFQVYKEYCVHHGAAQDLVTQLEKRTEWANYLKECSYKLQARSNKKVSFSLNEMLTLPVQHLCRYPLQLGTLVKSTPKEALEYNDLNAANIIMTQVVAEIDDAKNAKDARTLKEKFMERFRYDLRLTKHFISDLSNIIISGALETIHYVAPMPKVKYHGVFIFSDYMIVVRVKRTSYEPKHFFPLSWLELKDLPDGEGLLTNSWLITCRHDNDCDVFEFGATCLPEKQLWLKAIRESMSKANYAKDFAISSLNPISAKATKSFNNIIVEPSPTVKRSRSTSSMTYSVDSAATSPEDKLNYRHSGYFDIPSNAKPHDANQDHIKSYIQQNQSLPAIMPSSSSSVLPSHQRSCSVEANGKFVPNHTAGKVPIKHSPTINRRSSIDVKLHDVSTLDTLHLRAKFQREQEVIQQQQYTNELNRRRSRLSFYGYGDMVDFERNSSPQPRESNSLPSTPIRETYSRASWAPGWSSIRRQRAVSGTKRNDDGQEENALDNSDGNNNMQENDGQENKCRARLRRRDTWTPYNHSPLADDNSMVLSHQDCAKVPQHIPLPASNRAILLSSGFPMSPLSALQERNKVLLSRMVGRLANTIGINATSRPKRISSTTEDENGNGSSQKLAKGPSLLRRASQHSQVGVTRPSPLRFWSNMGISTSANDSELPGLTRTISAPSSPGKPVTFTVKTPTEQQPALKSASTTCVDQNSSKSRIFRNFFNKLNKSSTITSVAETSEGVHVARDPSREFERSKSVSSARSRGLSISSGGTDIAANYGPLDEQDDFMPITFRKFLEGESLFRSFSGNMVKAPTTGHATLESDSESDEDMGQSSDPESKRENHNGTDSSLNSSSSIDLSHSEPSTLHCEAVPCHTRDSSGTKDEWNSTIVPRRSSTSNSRSSEESEHTLKASEREIGFRRA